MTPIDMILSRVDAKPNGSDRWRSACPSCGGGNKSKLSIGVGENGAVLLRCWAGCPIEVICGAVGMDVVDLFPPKDAHAAPLRRRRMLSASQALDILDSESMTVWVVASDIARGKTVSEADAKRVATAAGRIGALREEVKA